MLTVLFGAGASYDSIPQLPPSQPHAWRPPLAEELWDTRFDPLRAQWRQADEIVPIVRGRALGSVEETLAVLAAEGGTYPIRASQIEATRWYLHFLLWSVGRHWGDAARGLTNYVTLLGELDRVVPTDEPICLVTFNYDRFIDDALGVRGVDLSAIDRYTSDARFKLFKVHGSADWAAEVDIDLSGIEGMNVWAAAYALIERAPWEVSNRLHKVTEWPIGKIDDKPAAPVLALPIAGKNRLALPSADEELLMQLLPLTTHLLIVGWKGQDALFVDLLRSTLSSVRGLVVSGTDSRAVIERLGLAGDIGPFRGGFTDFVQARGAGQLYGPETTPASALTSV